MLTKIKNIFAWFYNKSVVLASIVISIFVMGLCLFMFVPIFAYLGMILVYIGIIMLYVFGVVLIVALFSLVWTVIVYIGKGILWILRKLFNFGK